MFGEGEMERSSLGSLWGVVMMLIRDKVINTCCLAREPVISLALIII